MKRFEEIENISIRLPTSDDDNDAEIKAFDFTYLNNVDMCPVWGIVRYGLGKTYGKGRAMALEAGKAAHDVFAAVRLLELLTQGLDDHFLHHGTRLFGADRFADMRSHLQRGESRIETDQQGWLNFALSAFHSSGFYDDPRDRRRTVVNIEEACIAYFDRWRWGEWPLYVHDESDPTSLVGIELPANLIIEFDSYKMRYTGRMDGLHRHKDGLHVHENKTSARVDDAWRAGLTMSHQPTGYCVAASLLLEQEISVATIHGMAIPLPRTYDSGGIVRFSTSRDRDRVADWLRWIFYNTQLVQEFEGNPLLAPQRTHSCNRFFRPCTFIEMCGSPAEERQTFLEEMEYDPWDPLVEEGS